MAIRRLSFVENEPWDEQADDKRVRWFGHPFGADPARGVAEWVATRHPERSVREGGDAGVIARFELPADD